MKFTNGFWRNKPGVQIFNACGVYEYELETRAVTAFLPHFDVQHRGQTLWGPNLTLRLSSPLNGVIRVQVWHYTGCKEQGPHFLFEEMQSPDVSISEDSNYIYFTSGDLAARLFKGKAWDLSFFCGEKMLTNSRSKNLGYVLDASGRAYLKEELALSVGENIYGFGERFTPFIKNGQVIETYNADGGTSSELAYKCVPFYLSSRGYGVFVNDPGPVSFEVASEKVARVQFSLPGEYLEYLVIAGPEPKTVLERYTALLGRPALPPPWSFGLWLTTSFVTDYDEATVKEFIEGMFSRQIPLSVFHFDCFWMREYHWCDFTWDSRYFPDPKGFLARLKARGLKICVWINPYIAQRSSLFVEGKEKGYLLKKTNGDVWQTDAWQPGMAIVDFTNPAACHWFEEKLSPLLELGVDCFKTDFGEEIPVKDVVWFDGSDPSRMHNYYTFLYNQTVFTLLRQKRGMGEALVFARSATAGSQRFPVHWGGDCTATYESMAETLRGGLSLCLSGFGFWSHDISGFEATATPDLYKRWVAFGLLSSHSRLHGNSSYRVPWLFDEEAVEVLRFFTQLKCQLMPELWGYAWEAHTRGIPLMRAMLLEFPADPVAQFSDRQYLLGESLLAAPVFSESGEVEFYLPDGTWTDFFTEEPWQGGRYYKQKYDYFALPFFVRPSSLLAVGHINNRPDYDYALDVELRLYELRDGGSARKEVKNNRGDCELIVEISRQGRRYEVQSEGIGKPWSLYLANRMVLACEGAEASRRGRGFLVQPKNYAGSFSLEVGAEHD